MFTSTEHNAYCFVFLFTYFLEKVQGNGFASMVNERILHEANHADLRQSGTSPANRFPMVGDLLSGPIFQISLLGLSVNRRRLLVRLPTSL